MYCRKCGSPNEDGAVKCASCGEMLKANVPNYLVYSILVTLFCCLPFGIVAIVYAAQVNGKIAAGDMQGAMDSSKKAKTWCWVAFGVGLAVTLLYMLLMVFGSIVSQQ